MRLYFLRHGIAEDRHPGGSDHSRRLTPEGVEEMERVSRGMQALGLDFDLILTSPLTRARETAGIVARTLRAEECLREEPRLACGCRLGDLQSVLTHCAGKSRVLLVGHEPDFSTLASALTGGSRVRMKKASLACVATDLPEPGRGELRWLLEAEQLGRIR